MIADGQGMDAGGRTPSVQANPKLGVGILADDSFGHITLELRGACDKARPRTEIEIREAT